jgi:cytochrome b subunit of formate dehydrogenase
MRWQLLARYLHPIRAFTILIAAVSPSWLAPANFAMLKWAVDIFNRPILL